MYTIKGNIHIHSTHSDGSATIDEIARAAAKAGLDFIIVTDHNTLKGLCDEGYRHGVLVLCGTEVNTARHHYLALNVTSPVPQDDENPQAVIDAVNAQGGFGFIAHPYEVGSPLVYNGITYPWENWDVDGFCGIEVWNWCAQWRDGAQTIAQGLYYAYLNPAGPITGPCPQAFARLDQIAQHRKVVAIAGSDAHAWPIHRGPIRRDILPYEYLFKTATNVLLLKEPFSNVFSKAKAQVYNSLLNGNALIINRLLAENNFFDLKIVSDINNYNPGDDVPLEKNTHFDISCIKSKKYQINIKKNGSNILTKDNHNVFFDVKESGVYRIEVKLGGKPWVFTNPIYIS